MGKNLKDKECGRGIYQRKDGLYLARFVDKAGSTIRQTYLSMGSMFRSAVMNGMIGKHPMDGVRYTKPV